MSTTLRETFSSIADAIRAKGVDGQMTPLEMPAKIESIPTGGGSILGVELSSLVEEGSSGQLRKSSGPFYTSATSLGPYTLRYGGASTKSVSAPNLSSIGPYAMDNFTQLSSQGLFVTGLESISIPSLQVVEKYGLSYCCYRNTSLSAIDLGRLADIGDYGLQNFSYDCGGIKVVKGLSSIRMVGQYGMFQAFGASGEQYANKGISALNLDNLLSVGSSGMSYAFRYCTQLKDVTISSPLSIGNTGCNYIFGNCSQLTSVSIPDIRSYGQLAFSYAFQNCGNLRNLVLGIKDFNNQFGNYAFQNTTALTSITFPSAENISFGANVFQQYTLGSACKVLRFPALTRVTSTASTTTTAPFRQCTYVNKIYFPELQAITTQYLFYSCTGLTELHFAAKHQSAIEATAGYATKWGAPAACNILFDL